MAIPAVAASAVALDSAPAARASTGPSCTGWNSTIDPPTSIRVGRGSGAVETVNFRTYVARVMAKEWNVRPPAALETAAVAVKQYAWFYALAGKWRKSYVNGKGECFDVKDSTADQIYRSDVTPLPRIWTAVDETWALSVRKSDRFFLTTYRAGQAVPCGADATGSRLFAKSVIACANDGLSRERIQRIYYAPDLTFHWSEREKGQVSGAEVSVDAAIGKPDVRLRTGIALRGAHARISWDPNSRRPQGATYQLQRIVSGSWSKVSLASATQTSIDLRLKPGVQQGFRVRLRDSSGNTGAWYSTGTFKPRLVQDGNTTGVLSWTGAWSKVSNSNASGGTVRRSIQAGSSVTYTFTGRSVALIGTKGPKHGIARVFVDGTLEAEIDLYAAKNRWRRLVFTRQWEKAAAHTVRIEVVAVNGRTQVDIDGFLVHP
jgi:hypothetical protein